MKRKLIIFFVLQNLLLCAQQYEPGAAQKQKKPEYFRKEEIIVDNKRYRIHNNYLTFGPGFLSSSIRKTSQKSLGIDFQFHIRRQHFQAGVMMSGETIGSNNNIGAHIGYGLRKETRNRNLAFFVGPSYFTGVEAIADSVQGTVPRLYDGIGLYGCMQGIYKITYDIGLGAELFGEFSARQSLGGIKLIVFFSSAYVGPKKNYNPNVRKQPK